ncbi:hypothetical protein BGZ83_004585 [Gryganskiella cystojenkinii]|nr:hypothetical protein BGZ83_004585 [Gryganskiella cystojenkinii]
MADCLGSSDTGDYDMFLVAATCIWLDQQDDLMDLDPIARLDPKDFTRQTFQYGPPAEQDCYQGAFSFYLFHHNCILVAAVIDIHCRFTIGIGPRHG